MNCTELNIKPCIDCRKNNSYYCSIQVWKLNLIKHHNLLDLMKVFPLSLPYILKAAELYRPKIYEDFNKILILQ
jgi:hypothetical protein